MSNNLDPDQDQQNDPDQDQHSVGPDLGPNCLFYQYMTKVAASKARVNNLIRCVKGIMEWLIV